VAGPVATVAAATVVGPRAAAAREVVAEMVEMEVETVEMVMPGDSMEPN